MNNPVEQKTSGKSRPVAPDSNPNTIARRIIDDLCLLGLTIGAQRGLAPNEVAATRNLALEISAPFATTHKRHEHTEASAQLLEQIAKQIDEAAKAQSSFRLGRVFCFQCDSPDCTHSQPTNRGDTFVGYSPTGKPTWQSFLNLCIEGRDERVDRLYASPPEVIARILWANQLSDGLLPAFSRRNQVYQLLGQVMAGLVPLHFKLNDPLDERVALTFQIVETGSGPKRRRLRLNIIGLTPDEIGHGTIEQGPRQPAERLRRLIAESQRRLDTVAFRLVRDELRNDPQKVASQVEPLLLRIKTELERIFKPEQRRTLHAQSRHHLGGRPTSNALTDVQTAPDERILYDTRRDTIIVIGKKSRAHVFTAQGQHVTSLLLQPGELDRKLTQKRWQPLDNPRIQSFRSLLGS